MPTTSCTAIIVASGSGRRLGFDKLLWHLSDTPVLMHSLRAICSASLVDSVVVVCPHERWVQLPDWTPTKPVRRVDGGTERQDSVACGLAALPPGTTHVAVHDAARPLVSPMDVNACIQSALATGAAALAHPAVDTMKRTTPDAFCVDAVGRENVWCMETPQVARVDWLLDAFKRVANQQVSVTDEVSALMHAGYPVKLVCSTRPNPKITYPADLELAQALQDHDRRSHG